MRAAIVMLWSHRKRSDAVAGRGGAGSARPIVVAFEIATVVKGFFDVATLGRRQGTAALLGLT